MAITVSSLALMCFALLGAGYLLLLVLGRSQRLAPIIRDAWPILFTETLIVGAAAGAFWIGGLFLTVGLLLLTARIGYEAVAVANRRRFIMPPLYFSAGLPAAVWLTSLFPIHIVIITALVILVVGLGALASGQISSRSRGGTLLVLLLFPVIPLLIFTASGLSGDHGAWILGAFILVETFDSYALLGGKLFGRRKAFPALSPHKTIEGLLVGTVMLVLTTALLGAVLAKLPLHFSAALALLAGVLTITGDLAASRLKRRSGVKDFPSVLPYQGGLLDITDAWITTGAGFCVIAILLDIA